MLTHFLCLCQCLQQIIRARPCIGLSTSRGNPCDAGAPLVDPFRRFPLVTRKQLSAKREHLPPARVTHTLNRGRSAMPLSSEEEAIWWCLESGRPAPGAAALIRQQAREIDASFGGVLAESRRVGE